MPLNYKSLKGCNLIYRGCRERELDNNSAVLDGLIHFVVNEVREKQEIKFTLFPH